MTTALFILSHVKVKDQGDNAELKKILRFTPMTAHGKGHRELSHFQSQ
jgi:hypothetical protein